MSNEQTTKLDDERSFELAQREAKVYTTSTLVPKDYQGNEKTGNVLIAMNMAKRMGADPLMVMQDMHVIHGKPSFSAKFLIACFNRCGRFSTIKYEFNDDKTSCVAYCNELATGDRIEGPEVTTEMAKAEGWSTKAGSKWKTMPSLMLRYRAAAFLIRTTAPEIGIGVLTHDEVADVTTQAPVVTTTTQDVMRRLEAPAETDPHSAKSEVVGRAKEILGDLAE